MHGVQAIPSAVLLHFDALAVVDLVLGRDVVATLANLALQGDRNSLVAGLGHRDVLRLAGRTRRLTRGRMAPGIRYLRILVTRPAPTVRPPSRIANRKPSSIAIG